jgi:SAM-dependent methyltransferase
MKEDVEHQVADDIFIIPHRSTRADALYESSKFLAWNALLEERIKYYTTKASIAGRLAKLSYRTITELNSIDGWVIDIGCGDGAQLELLKNKERYIGIDKNLDRLRILKKNYPEATVVYTDASDLPFIDKSISAVFSSNAFEHIYYLKDAILESHRVLRNNGIMKIIVPTEGGAWSLGRYFISKPHFQKKYPTLDFDFISRLEHCNQANQISRNLELLFQVKTKGIPFYIPSIWLNAFLEFTCRKDVTFG